MDLVHERATIVREEEEEEDMISKLPDDIIHHILSFLDMKYTLQTRAVSRKWKRIWTTMPYLNLDSKSFFYVSQFAKFVKEALSHRNKDTNVSAVDLKFAGLPTQYVIKSIVNYANSHHIRQMTIVWFTPKSKEVPQFFFTSKTLKHLSLVVKHPIPHLIGAFGTCYLLESTWDFPALETLYLSGMELVNYDRDEKNIKLFSKCVNLKDLTLHVCSMYRMKIVNVCCPQLSNLTMKDVVAFPEVLEVFSPKLKNLTASIMSTAVGCRSVDFLQLSVEGSISLDKVNLSKPNENDLKTRNFSQLLNLLQTLSSAKFLILDMEIIQTLASDLVQLSCEPCPFHNLRSLKINTSRLQHTDPMPPIPTQIENYLLDNSSNAAFFIDTTQVSRKRARQEVHENTLANKVAKLEEKIQNRDAVIVEQKEKIQMLEAAKLQYENFMSCVIKSKIGGLKVQIERGNSDYEVIRSVGSNIKSLMDLIPESLRVDIEAQFSTQYEELKSLLLTCIDPSEWAKIEKELGIKRNSERNCCDNIGMQSDISVAELPKSQSPSSSNTATSSRTTL